MVIERIAVLGAGQMGNGIAQVAACAGYDVVMIDIKQDYVDKGLAAIEHSLNRVVSKGRMTQDAADAALEKSQFRPPNQLLLMLTLWSRLSLRFLS